MNILPSLTVKSRLRGFGPSVPPMPLADALRAGLGAMLALALAVGLAVVAAPDPWLGVYLIAPFGATSVLIFAAPNSPLAQPWSAIVGNTVAAVAALVVCRLAADAWLAIPLSVGSAIIAMALCRATHPPGGAIAMTVALGAKTIMPLGFSFALAPVASGTTLLVLVGMLYARATGRRYPLRQFGETNANGTTDPVAPQRLGLTEAELSDILVRYRQSLNLGVEDLARLIAAAEMQAASHRIRPQAAEDIMSRDLVTVGPDTPLPEVAALFARHGFTSLPVTDATGRFLGVIFQLHLITRFHADIRPDGRLPQADAVLNARDVMATGGPLARPDTPVAALLPQLAASGADAVPVLQDQQIVGIVTRTDLIAALARHSLQLGRS